MKFLRTCAAAASLTLPGALALAPTPAFAGGTYQYTINQHGGTDSFTDVGLCNPGPAQINLTNLSEVLHVSATQAGLTNDQIFALLNDDPTGIIVRATDTQNGNFRVVEADGHVYTGHFSNWFGGGATGPNGFEFGGTFNAQGVSDDGRQITSHDNAHEVFRNGEPVISLDNNHTTGC